MSPPDRQPGPTDPSPSRMWGLGAFVGEIWRAVKQPAETDAPKARTEVGRTTEQRETLDAEGRRVTLRRTVIEEIDYPADQPPGQQPKHPSDRPPEHPTQP